MLDMTVIYDLAIVALRVLMPVYAIIIVYQCYAAMRRRRRPEKPLVTLYNTVTGQKLPVIFWENSIGRSKSSDIVVDDPAVSRNHCVLLRRASGWYICDTGSKGGTYVNGEAAEGRTRVLIDDVINVGNSQFQFLRGEDYDENLRYSGSLKGKRQACNEVLETYAFNYAFPFLYVRRGGILAGWYQQVFTARTFRMPCSGRMDIFLRFHKGAQAS